MCVALQCGILSGNISPLFASDEYKTMLYKSCKCNKNAARCRLTSIVFGIVTINTTWIHAG